MPDVPHSGYPAVPGKRILVLSVSAGAGHLRAAQAIEAQAALVAGAEVIHLDVMRYVPAGFRTLYTGFYLTLVNRLPTLWGCLYQSTNKAQPDGALQTVRRAFERLNTRALLREIDALAPDAIICTHFLPAELLSHAAEKRRPGCPVWVQVTDFDLHRMWVQPHIAGYFAASEEVAFRMRARGIPPHTIHVTGIPIMPTFGAMLQRDICAKEMGLDPRRMTLVLIGGGAGLGGLDTVAAALLEIDEDFQLIVMAGRNAVALNALRRLAAQHPGRLLPQGYNHRIERVLACADLVITKPGGLTCAECLALGLPMIVNNPIRGQEERNADFLLEQGVALKACDPVTLEYRVRYLLRHPDKLSDMRRRARALGRPDAARDVLKAVMATESVYDNAV
ncbi:MGDG synthase family glycosyltransferase [Noviherbaspirillum sp.]|uniref:MGDG synthase family glycosyltransferase n=1 Tax=Noviherbaspirillum sp. TaxID=1926288 RepID=UPI003FA5C736